MKSVAWMAAASLVSAATAVAIVGRQAGGDIILGMLGPLAAAAISWVLTERTYRRHPERLTAMMASAFFVKMVCFGAYVAVMLKVVEVHPVPFIASFTSYFIALYLTEALLMRRLFAGG